MIPLGEPAWKLPKLPRMSRFTIPNSMTITSTLASRCKASCAAALEKSPEGLDPNTASSPGMPIFKGGEVHGVVSVINKLVPPVPMATAADCSDVVMAIPGNRTTAPSPRKMKTCCLPFVHGSVCRLLPLALAAPLKAGTTGGSHISVAVGDDKQSFNEVANVGGFDPSDLFMNHFHDFSIHGNVPPVMLHRYHSQCFGEVIEQCEKSMRTTGLVAPRW